MSVMSKSRRPKPAPATDDAGLTALYVRLDQPTSDALRGFVASQLVPPSNAAVTLKALHEFLRRHGHWPPKG